MDVSAGMAESGFLISVLPVLKIRARMSVQDGSY